MGHGYEEYCLADPSFYDDCTATRGDDVDFPVAGRDVPAGWSRTPSDDWLVYWPEGAAVPPQGWKVHVSACLDNAEDVLDVVFDYCTNRRIPFKFIRSLQLLFLRNAKYADRGHSGKFVTIYPASEADFEMLLTELSEHLDGQEGPYILSDLRWGNGPLYVRYGGFAERYCTGSDGTLQLAIEDASGVLVPDHRGPTFSPPDWVEVPACLAPHLEARAAASLTELPYRIERALHFSNGGGLYAGVDERTGDQVILKEARPHAGLDTERVDAVGRLQRESDMLKRLEGLGLVPGVRDQFVLAGHHFLVTDFVEGLPLSAELVSRYPLLSDHVDDEELAAYTAWATELHAALEVAVAAMHTRGVVFGDLHPDNVLVRPDGTLALVDLEVAFPVEENRRPTLADPGFGPPGGCTGADIDHHALACMRLYLFLPLTNLFALDRSKASHLAQEIGRVFPVPHGYLDEAVRTITRGCPVGTGREARPVWDDLEPSAEGWERARASMAAAILASATPGRDDRLFPGDIKQFDTGALNLAHGAAGVLYALAETDSQVSGDHEDWLIERATHPEAGVRLGFYDGLHGVAYVLDRIGHRAEARKVLDICGDELRGRFDRLGLDLYGGLAGIGLNLAHLGEAHGDPALLHLAGELAEHVADRLGGEDDVPSLSGGGGPRAGLLWGSSGPALLFVRLYERSRDPALLDLAATALRQDLRRCVQRDDGALEVDEGWRTMPYLADGSVGIGMVLDDYLRYRQDEQFVVAAEAIRRAASGGFYIEPGLFHGRAGMLLHLARTMPAGMAAEQVLDRHIRRLAWHAMAYDGSLAFPGEQLLRLSMDLGTGTAGVLLALGAVLHDCPVHLPFLGPHAEVADTTGPAPKQTREEVN